MEINNVNIRTKYRVGQEVLAISKKPGWKKITCPICNGKQIIIYRNPDEDRHDEKHMECPKCYGKGIIDKYEDGCHVTGLHTINSISIRVTEDETVVRYNLSHYGAAEENKVFSTLEKANEACEYLNICKDMDEYGKWLLEMEKENGKG